jgi:hypothetical protein
MPRRRTGHRDPLATHNERVKLFSGFLNALGLGLIGFAILRPLTGDGPGVTAISVYWGVSGLVLHGVAHYILRYLEQGDDE